MSSSDIYCENSTREANIRQLEKEGISLDDYPDIIDYDEEVHPRNTKDYPYGQMNNHGRFLLKAMWVHGVNKFDYSNSAYTNSKEKLGINCQNGHLFNMIPNSHVVGRQGCPRCHRSARLIQSEWVERCSIKHHGKFDYSLLPPNIKANEKVKVRCIEHDHVFLIKPTEHLHKGYVGCKYCVKNYRTDQEYFLQKCKETHGDQYDYSKVEYTRAEDYITVICRIHGEFKQNAKSHSLGRGCFECGRTKRLAWHPDRLSDEDKSKPCMLYLLKIENPYSGRIFYKIGITTTSINQRFVKIKREGFDIEVVRIYHTTLEDALIKEELFMEVLRNNNGSYRVHDLKGTETSGWTECFEDPKFIDHFSPIVE